jgi:hypothetical protein
VIAVANIIHGRIGICAFAVSFVFFMDCTFGRR